MILGLWVWFLHARGKYICNWDFHFYGIGAGRKCRMHLLKNGILIENLFASFYWTRCTWILMGRTGQWRVDPGAGGPKGGNERRWRYVERKTNGKRVENEWETSGKLVEN